MGMREWRFTSTPHSSLDGSESTDSHSDRLLAGWARREAGLNVLVNSNLFIIIIGGILILFIYIYI